MFEESYAKVRGWWHRSRKLFFFSVCMVEKLRHCLGEFPLFAEDSSTSVHKLYPLPPPGDTELLHLNSNVMDSGCWYMLRACPQWEQTTLQAPRLPRLFSVHNTIATHLLSFSVLNHISAGHRRLIRWNSLKLQIPHVLCVIHIDIKGRFTVISDVSVPYQYRPFSAPDMWELFYLKYN
jgi:hypothetical protein